MDKPVNEQNITRFSGFSDLYNGSRPVPPAIIPRIIGLYLTGAPGLVVDIGSGTGLSALIWADRAERVVGIEPNDDMRAEAEKNTRSDRVTYQKGHSNDTGLAGRCADLVTVSQAFHWMDIGSTLAEIDRILKPGGVLAIYDCDWPPSVDWVIEKAWRELRDKCDNICAAGERHAVRNDKNSYIDRLTAFGRFRFTREAVCHSAEPCTPGRLIGLALSQGGIQDALKLDPAVKADIDAYRDLVNTRCPGEFEIVFSYRLRIAVK